MSDVCTACTQLHTCVTKGTPGALSPGHHNTTAYTHKRINPRATIQVPRYLNRAGVYNELVPGRNSWSS